MEPSIAYRSDMNREQKPSKCVRSGNGCEVISNDGQMKIILSRKKVLAYPMEQEYYVADYYVKEGDGWIITNTKATFKDVAGFFAALNSTEEFSQAMEEYNSSFS